MNAKVSKLAVFCAFIVVSVFAAGCIFSGAGNSGESAPQASAPPSGSSAGLISVPGPSATTLPGTYVVSPGTNGTPVSPAPTPKPGINGTSTPTPRPSVTPVPTATPKPVISGKASDWGSDKSTYSRGNTATGWTYVTNTGNVPIEQIDFTFAIKRTIFFVPVSKTYTYSATGLNILPGTKQQVAFSLSIPSDYQGVSTAGDYQLTATASLAGTEIGSDSRNIKIV